jgi:hypothetical protein
MPQSRTPSELTRAHFYAFGYIVSTYAKVEQGFKFIIAQIIGVRRHVALVLSEPYTSENLRDVIKSLAESDLAFDKAERVVDLAKRFEKFGPLRNAIGHNLWKEGARADAVKPMRLDIRSGKTRYKGLDATERDWTLAELDAEAQKLNQLHAEQVALLNELETQEGERQGRHLNQSRSRPLKGGA